MKRCLLNRERLSPRVLRMKRPLRFLLFPFLLLSSTLLLAQQQRITGKVSSNDSTLAGVTVQVKGTSEITQTDENGRFSLNAAPNSTLVFTYTGHQSQEVKLGGRSEINVQLLKSNQSLEEVVVVGYGTQKKATLTGSVATVKGAEIVKTPSVNVSNSLGGRLAGLVTVTPSGEPGADGSILRIRGINTLGNNSPLIVVDGIPGRSLERLDPATIESVTVLKDASAAIYGAQAANGVILITTKRGKSGKPTVTASYNQGFGRPTVLPKMADAATYATMINEINEYAGRAPKYTEEELQKYRDGSDRWSYPNTNWFDEVLKPWSAQNYGNVSVIGGSENLRYFVSVSSRTQNGYYYNSGTKYSQYDLRSNIDANINKYITLGLDISGRLEDRNYPTRSAGSIFRMVMRGKPNETAYWPNGLPGPDIEYGDNPVVVSTKATGTDHNKWYVINTNAKLNIKVPWVSGLSLTANAAIDKNINFRKLWQTPWYLYSWDGVTRDASGDPQLEKSQKGFSSPALQHWMQDKQNILVNGLINYERNILVDHHINLLVGAERITGKGDSITAYRRNFASALIPQLFAGAQDEFMSNDGYAYQQARLNYFGRVNYGFQEKYLAEFVWRYQGSYIFPEEKRFGFFPGLSVGYVISKENFFDNVNFIDNLKLRASWGKTGNDQIPEWQYLSTYGLGGIRAQPNNPPLPFITNGNVQNPALYETLIPNLNATWESAKQSNYGFDAQLLKNRLFVTADYFVYKRSDILWARNASVPGSTGLIGLLPRENIASVSNRGFDFSINYNNQNSKFLYSVGLNGGYQKNRIDFWDEPAGRPDYQKSTGYPIGSTLFYNAIGIFRDESAVSKYPHWSGARAGDIIFEDVNGDGAIDDKDKIRIEKSNIPTFTGGFTVAMQYAGFDFSLLLQGAFGGVRYITTESGEIGNFLQSYADERWTSANPDAKAPRTFNRGNEYWVGNWNTFWLRKTDYVRLKNIELGYTLPATLLKKVGIQSVRIYTNAFNLLTWAPDLKDEFDPELTGGDRESPTGGDVNTSGQGYPLQKIINGGISVTF
jgi:TonB-dependent starch-binding outer membrane protein SusC